MENQSIGAFIYASRKAKGLTQKQLAEALGVTDKAVSKWERGVSCPDISLLTPLAAALEVHVTELLAGQQNAAPAPETEETVKHALTYSATVSTKKSETVRWYCFIGFTFCCLLTILICVICDFALNRSVTWSLIVDASLALSWGVLAPLLQARRRRFLKASLALTLLIVPFLGCLALVLNQPLLFTLGTVISIPSLAYLWFGFFLFAKLRGYRWVAAGILTLLIMPLNLAINSLIDVFTHSHSESSLLMTGIVCVMIALLCLSMQALITFKRHADKD